MERRGTALATGPDLSDLREIADAKGPFVSLVLDTGAGVENAAFTLEQHWRTVRRDLERDGADARALAQLDDVVPGAHRAGSALCAMGEGPGHRVVVHDAERPPYELARCAPLPVFTPVLAQRQREVPYV